MQEAANELQKPPPVYCFLQSCLAWVCAASHGRPVWVPVEPPQCFLYGKFFVVERKERENCVE